MHSIPAISVIIPVYNTEQYLSKCLSSVCESSLKNIEIICINDGSNDNSDAIIRKYADFDKRIQYISFYKNLGVSIARNVGIAAAHGEYLAFLDSDDYINIEFYNKLYTEAKNNSSEIVKGTICFDWKNPQIDKNINDQIRKNRGNFFYYFCSAIYNSNFIKKNNISFLQDKFHGQDLTFICQAVINSNKIDIVDDAIYHVVYRDNSTTRQKNKNITYVTSYLSCLEFCISYLNEKKIFNDIYICIYAQVLRHCISLSTTLQNNMQKEAEKLCTDIFYRLLNKCVNPKNVLIALDKYYYGISKFIMNNDKYHLYNYLQQSLIQKFRTNLKKLN